MISIITATYNSAATLADNLASIREQTTPVEHLLIDGGSTDGTIDIINDYCSGSNHVYSSSLTLPSFITEPDQGIYDAMNKGLRLAQGEIIGILNADDFYASPDVLEKVAKVFENPDVSACYGDLVYVREAVKHGGYSRFNPVSERSEAGDSSTSPLPFSISAKFNIVRYWKSGSFELNKFYLGWMPPHPTLFVRRSVYEKHGPFNLDLGSAADYEIMLRFLLKHRIKTVYIPEVLVNMRVGGVSNASVGNRLKANRNDRRAWDVNGLRPRPWTMWMKPMRKIPQWFSKP